MGTFFQAEVRFDVNIFRLILQDFLSNSEVYVVYLEREHNTVVTTFVVQTYIRRYLFQRILCTTHKKQLC